MKCPKCGARFNKALNVCRYCGTNIKQIETASHNAVTEAKENFEPEKIVLSTIWPADLSRKNTFWLCLFLGLFGAHNFYTKRYFKALAILVTWAIGLVLFWIFMIMTLVNPEMYAGFIHIYLFGGGLPGLFLAVAVLMWIFDFAKIVMRWYKVPVVLND